jgi:bifunctional non-homologous end joining protein LigD
MPAASAHDGLMADTTQLREIDGHEVRITHPEKVMYPATGTTKADVIDYLVGVAPHLIPLAEDRPVTRKRWIHGVGTADEPGKDFFHKDIDDDAPEWFTTRTQQHDDHTNDYPLIDSPAVLAWYAQRGTLEFHVPQWRFGPRGARRNPDRMILDLDPGEGAGLPECIEVAQIVRELLDAAGIPSVPATSGSKGIHLYGRLDGKRDADAITDFAHELAQSLEQEHPGLVTSNIRKAQREGKVLLDWSQNRAAKTTVTPYSLRGRQRPTVAMPRTWEELADPSIGHVEYTEVSGILKRRPCPMRALMEAAQPK